MFMAPTNVIFVAKQNYFYPNKDDVMPSHKQVLIVDQIKNRMLFETKNR